jgi:hypothetical protein
MNQFDSNDRDFNFPVTPENIRHVTLPTGTLHIRVDRSQRPLDMLLDFAARQNPKRGFLFVSKVLGKHIPAAPSVIRDIHRRPAAQIGNLPGPVLFIGHGRDGKCGI